MKKTTLLLIATLSILTAQAQTAASRTDIRIGAGISMLGTGDMTAVVFENELNHRLNRHVSIGGGLGFGRSNKGVFTHASFSQLHSGIFISPFGNERKNDFRIGAGLTWYWVSDFYISTEVYTSGQLVYREYTFDKRSSAGFSITLENTYALSDKYRIGVKLFTQPYFNGDINSGILVKLGARI